MSHRPLTAFAALVLLPLLGACAVVNSGTNSALAQTVGASWGPCGGPRDSVQALHGTPDRREYGEDEDLSEKTKVHTQEWGYRVPPDSARVIAFTWGDGVRRCQVTERRLTWRAWEREI
jgi:hypothetical protein